MSITLPKNRPPTHPGHFLAEGFLEPNGVTAAAFAAHIGVSAAFLSGIINGRRPIGAEMAMRLERATGVTAQNWLSWQLACDVYAARHSEKAASIKKIKLMKPTKKMKAAA